MKNQFKSHVDVIEYFSKYTQEQYLRSKGYRSFFIESKKKFLNTETNIKEVNLDVVEKIEALVPPVAAEIFVEKYKESCVKEMKPVKRIKKLCKKLSKICNDNNFNFLRAIRLMIYTSLALIADFVSHCVLLLLKNSKNFLYFRNNKP